MDEKSYTHKTPQEIKFLEESHEFVRALVLDWKKDIDSKLDKISEKAEERWDLHDKKSEDRWCGLRVELEKINSRIASLPCDYRKGITESMQKEINGLKVSGWAIVISLLIPLLVLIVRQILKI
jgi:hypothetical protein